MADGVIGRIMGPILSWARARGRSGLAIVGALPGGGAESWLAPTTLPLPVPLDAAGPRQADVLVVVGRISHKLAPFVVRTHAAMARPASVLVVELEGSAHAIPPYAAVADVAAIIPVDVVVRGSPPSADLLARAVRALDARSRAGRP